MLMTETDDFSVWIYDVACRPFSKSGLLQGVEYWNKLPRFTVYSFYIYIYYMTKHRLRLLKIDELNSVGHAASQMKNIYQTEILKENVFSDNQRSGKCGYWERSKNLSA